MAGGTGLGRVRGLGSARAGAHHWMTQRMTALGNLALMIWFLVALFRLPSFSYESVTAWLSEPLAAVPMMLLVISVFWHLRLGLQVLIEDYVHDEASKFFCLILVNFYAIGAGALALFSVARIAFGAA